MSLRSPLRDGASIRIAARAVGAVFSVSTSSQQGASSGPAGMGGQSRRHQTLVSARSKFGDRGRTATLRPFKPAYGGSNPSGPTTLLLLTVLRRIRILLCFFGGGRLWTRIAHVSNTGTVVRGTALRKIESTGVAGRQASSTTGSGAGPRTCPMPTVDVTQCGHQSARHSGSNIRHTWSTARGADARETTATPAIVA